LIIAIILAAICIAVVIMVALWFTPL